MDFRLQSPYCSNYKIPSQQKGEEKQLLQDFELIIFFLLNLGLIMQHLIVRKLTR